MRTYALAHALSMALLAPTGSVAFAADGGIPFHLPWFTIGAAGGLSKSADGAFTLSGTCGQPDASLARGERFTWEGGFWHQLHCTPTLSVSYFYDDLTSERPLYLVLAWPASDVGVCILEVTTELTVDPAKTVWSPVPFSQTAPSSYGYSSPAEGRRRFFRLRAP